MNKKFFTILCLTLCCTVMCGAKELLRNIRFDEAGINKRPVPRWWNVKSGNAEPINVAVKLNKSRHIINIACPGKSAVIETHFYRIPCAQVSAGKSYLLDVSGSGKGTMQLKLHTYNAKGGFIKTIVVGDFNFENGGRLTIDNLAGYLEGAARFIPAIFIFSDQCSLTGISFRETVKKKD